ncbi:ATP-binding protein [Prosthecobacter fusiformis]|uniref:ATP-binding protein n=1 Tax=Prosthecobacter fusiformis TaxID=48464 RepID=UPI0014151152|nr:ATP-binding protein [Prosthecobacter fusiformis]
MREWPVTLILGPRQCGKSHLVKLLGAPSGQFFDLEDMVDETRLRLHPQSVLGEMRGLVIIDEAQRMPELMPVLRVLADRPGSPARFVLTGSVALPLRKTAGESLAGRINTIEMGGFGIHELNDADITKLWLRGGFPPSFLADTDAVSLRWRRQYLRQVLEGDLHQLVDTRLDALQLQRMSMGLAHYNGQIWNESELAQIVGTTPRTIGRYMDLFWRLFHVRLLPPYYVNVGKRLRKAPKLLFRDSGLPHVLLGIDSLATLQSHPKMGGSWEAFVIDQIIRLLGVYEDRCSHYGVHSGAELDLVIETPLGLIGFEIKYAPPTMTASMKSVMADLKPARLYAIYMGDRDYPLAGPDDPIRAIGLSQLPELAIQLREEFKLDLL